MTERFNWGVVIARFDVEPYTILKYHPYAVSPVNDQRSPEMDTVLYHGYLDGKDCHESWASLDDALAGLIVRRRLGPNCRQISQHFMAGLEGMKNNA